MWQEANRSLAGESGHDRLKFMQKILRMRQQYMISQVSLLYPVNTLIEPAKEQELDSFPSSSRSGNILVDENILIVVYYGWTCSNTI